MDDNAKSDPFYVGYLPTPKQIALFSAVGAAVMIGLAIGAGAALLATQRDPGPGRFRYDLGYQTVTGVLEPGPYPILRLPPDENHPEPWSIALSGGGKRGVQDLANELGNVQVDAGGTLIIHNGTMLLQVGGKVRLRPAEDPSVLEGFTPAEVEDLGTHTLKGEVVDSKCYIGAMRPGRDKAHMGCANLCLIGGVPPGFVTTAPDGTESWFLLADKDGQPLMEMVRRYVSLNVALTGDVERRDDMLIFKVDQSSVEIL